MNPKKCALSYIRRFIPGLAATMSVFTHLLKKGKPYEWSKECQEYYQQVQQLITKLPIIRAPIPRLPIKLYLAATLGLCLPRITMPGRKALFIM
ncbi:unnamed protein product [Prunus brigantina]